MPAPAPSDAAIRRAIAIWESAGRGPWRLIVRQGEVIIDAATESEQPAPEIRGNTCDSIFGAAS